LDDGAAVNPFSILQGSQGILFLRKRCSEEPDPEGTAKSQSTDPAQTPTRLGHLRLNFYANTEDGIQRNPAINSTDIIACLISTTLDRFDEM